MVVGRGKLLCSLLALLAALQTASAVSDSLLIQPQQIDSSYAAAMLDISCESDLVFYPSSTAEVAAHVSTQVKAAAAAGTGLKVRVSHKSFHSTAPFVCPGSSLRTYPDRHNLPVPVLLPGLQLQQQQQQRMSVAVRAPSNVTSVSLLLDRMRAVLVVDTAKKQMRVQAGMFVTQLLKEAAAAGLSVPLGSVPAFGDLTLGGVLVTGAHGTGHRTTSALGDIVAELTWVDGKGVVHTSARDSDAGRALVSGLGVAGIVTELLLQLGGPSHTAVDTRYKKNDASLAQDIQEMLKASPHLLVVWRPDFKTYTAHLTREANASVAITGTINNADVPKAIVTGLGKSLQLWQEDVHDLLPLTTLPILAAIHQSSIDRILAVNHLGMPMRSGVGDTNEMQAISCGSKCLWNLGAKIAMEDVHFSIELAHLDAWVADVKAILQAELWEGGAKRMRVMPPGYFWLRFGHSSNDFLGHTAGLSAPVHVQMSFMKSIANPGSPSKYSWVLDVLEQVTICKYKGKPHWGKNHERSFKHPACPIRDHLPLFGRMEAFAASSDPQHIFQPRLFEEIASRTANTYSPGCSVRGECYCLTDSHCAKGWSCLPSRAFPEYKACRLQHGLLPVIP